MAKPLAQLRRDADAAFARRDFRTGMQVLGQIVAVAPERRRQLAAARARHPADPADRRPRAHAPARARLDRRLHRLSARRQAGRGGGSARDARPELRRAQAVAAGARRAAALARAARDRRAARPIRAAARGARLPHARLHGRCRRGLAARLLPVLRRAARQAHRFLALRRRRRRGQAGAVGRREAALRRGPEARRALLRSRCAPACRRPCKETLSKSADYNIYVRDRKPFVRFTGKAYVLPRTGQRGIPVVSVNTAAVDVRDLSRSATATCSPPCSAAISSAASTATSSSSSPTRAAFDLEGRARGRARAQRRRHHRVPGRPGGRHAGARRLRDGGRADGRRRTRRRLRARARRSGSSSPTSASRAYSRRGRHERVRPFAGDAEPKGGIEMRLIARNNEVLATTQTDAAGRARSMPAWRAARAALRRRCWSPPSSSGDYVFLNLQGAGLRPHRPRRHRPRRAGRARRLRLYRARRLSHRRDRACHRAAARRARRRRARRAADPRGRAARRRRVPPRRRSPTRAWAAAACSLPIARLGADRHLARARLRRSQAAGGRRDHASWSRTTCPTASSSSSSRRAGRIVQASRPRSPRRPLPLRRAGAGLEVEGEVTVTAAKERPGFAGYQFGARRRRDQASERTDARRPARRPTTTARRRFAVTVDKLPATTRPLEARDHRAHGRGRRPRRRAQAHAAGDAERPT